MKSNPEFEEFNSAMDKILKADPVKVKALMEAEQKQNAEARAEKGERKRGRKSDKPD